MNNIQLFLCSIGPVQSFIKQARKTRDLYAGSQILSDLVKAGITACENRAKALGATGWELKFPNFNSDDNKASIPNRFIAKITFASSPEQDLLLKLADNVEGGVAHEIRAQFKNIAQHALDNCQLQVPEGFWEQIDNHLDIHWAFQPVTQNYQEAYRALEQLLGSVKNVRPFVQMTWQTGIEIGEKGRKCSLDGENNAVFYRNRKNSTGGEEAPAMIQFNGLNEKSNLTQKLDNNEWSEGEALSAVSTVKRLYKRGDANFQSYPSTSLIALQEQLKNCQPEVERYKLTFGKENFTKLGQEYARFHMSDRAGEWQSWNDQFFYEDNLNAKNIPNPEQLRLAKERHQSLKKAGLKEEKHYALIHFDGDNMGKWLSGENLYMDTSLEDFHRDLSSQLSTFAGIAKSIVDAHGQTVYAGGDDFLGFLNLHHLFASVAKLREEFHKTVNSKLSGKLPDQHLTFSAGIVIAHYKEPLVMVLDKAREMEKAAKENGDRNAFGLAVVKASGEIQQTVFKWDEDAKSPDGCSNWRAMEHIFKNLSEENLSNTFITSLTKELYQLAGRELGAITAPDELDALEAGLKTEIKRLVVRSKNTGKNISKENALQMAGYVERLYEASKKHNKTPTAQFVHALHIIDFIHQKINAN